jgi:hypothetical protein
MAVYRKELTFASCLYDIIKRRFPGSLMFHNRRRRTLEEASRTIRMRKPLRRK